MKTKIIPVTRLNVGDRFQPGSPDWPIMTVVGKRETVGGFRFTVQDPDGHVTTAMADRTRERVDQAHLIVED